MRSTRGSGLTDWQARCVDCIAAGLLEYEIQQARLNSVVDLNECKKWISLEKYQFGPRENHPYTVWRQEIGLLDEFFSLDIAFCNYKSWRNSYRKPRKPNQHTEKKRINRDENQPSLF